MDEQGLFPRRNQALGYAFDFEWTNKAYFHGDYSRTESYFANSELASRGLPGPEELAILEPLRGQIPEEVFTTVYRPPATDGSGSIRANLQRARGLLAEAGWSVENTKLVHTATGRAMTFEILLLRPDNERIALAYARNLERLGITVRVRTVDSAQYQYRVQDYDFDMVFKTWYVTLSPGNEQRYYWGSEAAESSGSRNLAGIKDPAVDTLVDLIAAASYDDGYPDTAPVSSFLANAWGLHDMHGNVWEWCQGPYLADPMDPASAAAGMADSRGGSYWDGPDSMESGHRNPLPLDTRASTLGFRVVVDLPPPPGVEDGP